METNSQCRMMIILCFAYLLWAVHGVPLVTRVQLSVQNQMRHVTVHYTAEEKPVVLWKSGSYISHLDNSTNSFAGNQGEATVRMYIEPRGDFLDHTLAAEIYSTSYHITLKIREGDIRLSQSKSSNVVPVQFKIRPEGAVTIEPDDIVNLDIAVESEDLSFYSKDHDWGSLSSFEYQSYPPVVLMRDNSHQMHHGHFENHNAFIMAPINFTSSSNTIANTTARIDSSFPYITGEYEFGVVLHVLSETNLVGKIILRRYVYLKDGSDESPFKRNVNFIPDRRNRKRVDILSKASPYTQADAMGFPKPIIKLFRDCQEVTEPEVRIFEIGTPYRTRNIFQFKNLTDSLTGTYYFKVLSGDFEIAKMNYIEKI